MLPDLASLWVAGAGAAATGLDFWEDVYGFSMAPVAAAIRADALQKAVVAVVPSQQVWAPRSLSTWLRAFGFSLGFRYCAFRGFIFGFPLGFDYCFFRGLDFEPTILPVPNLSPCFVPQAVGKS